MKILHVFFHNEGPQAGLLKDLLAGEGIDCLLRNDTLSSAIGEIPFIECRPELWVIDDETFPRAKLLLDGWLKQDARSEEDWACPACGEKSEAQFGACWNCGMQRECS